MQQTAVQQADAATHTELKVADFVHLSEVNKLPTKEELPVKCVVVVATAVAFQCLLIFALDYMRVLG